jgi:hypothetical protein
MHFSISLYRPAAVVQLQRPVIVAMQKGDTAAGQWWQSNAFALLNQVKSFMRSLIKQPGPWALAGLGPAPGSSP